MTRQQERILIYMEESGSITPLEAFAELGVTKLATRVSELRRGHTDSQEQRDKEESLRRDRNICAVFPAAG